MATNKSTEQGISESNSMQMLHGKAAGYTPERGANVRKKDPMAVADSLIKVNDALVAELVRTDDLLDFNELLRFLQDCNMFDAVFKLKDAVQLVRQITNVDTVFPGIHKNNSHIELIFDEFIEFILRAGLLKAQFQGTSKKRLLFLLRDYFNDILYPNAIKVVPFRLEAKR
eukprot:Rmarinus@m.28423